MAIIPCHRAMPSTWGPSGQQLHNTAAYKFTLITENNNSPPADSGDSDSSDSSRAGSDSDMDSACGDLLDNVKAADLADAYKLDNGLDLYVEDIDLIDHQACTSSSSPQKRSRTSLHLP